MIIKGMDNDKEFDWGNTSKDYAKYRDIYPQEFYDYILGLGACKDDQKVLDVGTGTGVLPRNMYKYGADWTAHSDYVHPVWEPDEFLDYFDLVSRNEFRIDIPFTRDGWHGRMRACRGVGASMSPETVAKWDKEHFTMLEANAPEEFNIKHYVSIAELKVKK